MLICHFSIVHALSLNKETSQVPSRIHLILLSFLLLSFFF